MDVACMFLSAWVTCFCPSSDITFDKGPQVTLSVSDLWSVLVKSLATQVHSTTEYHPKAKSLPEQVALCAAILDAN